MSCRSKREWKSQSSGLISCTSCLVLLITRQAKLVRNRVRLLCRRWQRIDFHWYQMSKQLTTKHGQFILYRLDMLKFIGWKLIPLPYRLNNITWFVNRFIGLDLWTIWNFQHFQENKNSTASLCQHSRTAFCLGSIYPRYHQHSPPPPHHDITRTTTTIMLIIKSTQWVLLHIRYHNFFLHRYWNSLCCKNLCTDQIDDFLYQ